jgi:hypothetical protein
VQKDVGAKLLIHGASVEAEGLDLRWIDFEAVSNAVGIADRARGRGSRRRRQVIYTSGTGEPEGSRAPHAIWRRTSLPSNEIRSTERSRARSSRSGSSTSSR